MIQCAPPLWTFVPLRCSLPAKRVEHQYVRHGHGEYPEHSRECAPGARPEVRRKTTTLAPMLCPRAAFDLPKGVFMQVRSVRKVLMIEVSAARGAVGAKRKEPRREHHPAGPDRRDTRRRPQ